MDSITEKKFKNSVPEIKDRIIVEANDLITSIAKMDKTPLKMFELAVSYIDTVNPPKNNIVFISKREMFQFFSISDNDRSTRFKQAMKSMVKEAVFQATVDGKEVVFAPISYVEWNEWNDDVLVEFGNRIMPYLVELKKNFTQYALSDVMDLESKYSIILYKWLSMNYNQYEHYRLKNNRTQRQLENYQNPLITVSELRQITNTVDTYKKFGMLQKRVIDQAITEINAYTHFNVSYEKITIGRSIAKIKFHIDKKAHWKDEEYKRDDEVAQLSIEQQQQQNQILFAKGVANPYTIKLLTANLITGLDMANQETIIGISKHVYPLYDALAKLNGEQALTEHLGYVSDKMIDYTSSKKNIVKYLQISAQQYLDDGIGTIVEENKKQRAEEKKITRKKQAKEVPEWSNSNYVETTTDDEKAKFAEWQKNMRKNEK